MQTKKTGHFPAPLPLPPHFNPEKTGEVWKVAYQDLAKAAREWAIKYSIPMTAEDHFKLALIAIDVQNTFCLPGFELFVGGRSGTGAVDDTRRLSEFIYRNLGSITSIVATMDTHQAMQIFHPIYLVNAQGEHPGPMTLVTNEDIQQGRWMFNPQVAKSLGIRVETGQKHLLYYTRELKECGKYDLTIWPYHAMLGGIGHALVPSLEEAIFFHTICRNTQPSLTLKGQSAYTESYSAIGPEVLTGADGQKLARKNESFLQMVIENDIVVIAGEAKSHCVAFTIDDLLAEINAYDNRLANKVYLLDDCASPVVVPGVVDYTDQADTAYQRFAQAGMHLVRSTDDLNEWIR
jgi:nicotinamidase-related amidase